MTRELNALELPQHENIVRYVDYFPKPVGSGNILIVFVIQVGQNFYIVMELCPNGSLKQAMSNGVFEADRTLLNKIIRGALIGLAFVHEKGFIHRDIKPASLMFT